MLCAQEETAITVTNQNLGLVKESRKLDLKNGSQTINLMDIPSAIDATSLLIESPDNSFVVLEQNYEYDLMSVDKALNKALEQQIWIAHPAQGMVSGKLLAVSGENIMLLDDEGSLQIIPRNDEQKILLKDYSKQHTSFITRPTLVWKVDASKSGQRAAQISYLTGGLTWQADYVGRLNEDDSKLTLAGWVTVTNESGKAFLDARLKLLAGDINVVKEMRGRRREEGLKMMAIAEQQFEEKEFFEYHLYSLQRKTDLANNQVKQIQLIPETTAGVKKVYQIDSHRGNDVSVIVTFKNTKDNGLGMALPAGKIRLYKADGADLEFIGEDRIDHTPKDETLNISVGKAFDIIAERNTTETQRPSRQSIQQKVEYVVRNHKDSDIEVEIIERLNTYQQTKLLSGNIQPKEKRADYFKFALPVKAQAEGVLKIEYMTSW
jgi:hypothetical protein